MERNRMATKAQCRANRRNAKKSTGPRTVLGKAQASKNATKHGLLAQLPVVLTEAQEEWADFRTRIINSQSPIGIVEICFAERIALLFWRMKRLAEFDANQYTDPVLDDLDDDMEDLPMLLDDMFPDADEAIRRLDIRGHVAPTSNFPKRVRRESGLTPAKKDERVIRYETHLHRTLMTTLHELQRMQAARGAHAGMVPQAVDVNLTVSKPSLLSTG